MSRTLPPLQVFSGAVSRASANQGGVTREWDHSMFIPLPLKGGIWIERRKHSLPFEIEKQNGEWLLWWGRLHVILTPIGWKPLNIILKGCAFATLRIKRRLRGC